MADRSQGLTDADFDELKRKRDDAISAMVDKIAAEQGWPRDEMNVHASHTHGCYCACADGGPCQHVFDGPWQEFEDGSGGTTTCSKCGTWSMNHDMWLF